MAATDEFKEAGLGVPMRLAVQNAINGKHNFDVETANHFSRVTGHSSSGGWGAFSKSLTNALLSDDDPSLHVGEMVEALGFHEDNFSSHFETHKFDQKKQDELREELHEVAAFVGAHVEEMVNSLREAIADPQDQQKVSDAYDASYQLADLLHQTHTVDEDDSHLLSAELAHEMTQTELKNYQSPISFHAPENIGKNVFSRAWKGTKRLASKAKQGALQLKGKAAKLVPQSVRNKFRNRNVVTNSSVVLGGRSAIPYLYLQSQCIVQIPDSILGATERRQFGIVSLSPDRAAKNSNGSLRYLLNPTDMQYYGCNFKIFMQVGNPLATGTLVNADPSSNAVVEANALLYRKPGDLQPSATGVIFPQSDVPAESRRFSMPKSALVTFQISIEVTYPNSAKSAIDFTAVKTKFDPKSRGSLRVQEMIGVKMVGLADNQYKGRFPGNPVVFLKGDDGEIYAADTTRNLIIGKMNLKEDRFIAIRPFPYTTGETVLDRPPSQSQIDFLEQSETDSLLPEDETEDWSTAPPLPPRTTSVLSLSDLMKQKQVMALQIKLHDAPNQRQDTRPFLNLFISQVDLVAGVYELVAIMLVLPRLTKKRDFPQSVRNAPSTRQKGLSK